MKIVGDVTCREQPVQKSGWFLGSNPQGEVVFLPFDVERGQLIDVIYAKGWTLVWGALEEGARILSRSDVKFTDEMETHVDTDSPELPQGFWNLFHGLVDDKG